MQVLEPPLSWMKKEKKRQTNINPICDQSCDRLPKEDGRDPRIAEGMVDESFAIEGNKKEGQIITFSTSEALKHGFCEAKVESINEILALNRISDFELDRF